MHLKHLKSVTYSLIYASYYQLILRSRVLEKLTIAHVVKKFPAFNGTQSFITVFKRLRHWNCSKEYIQVQGPALFSATCFFYGVEFLALHPRRKLEDHPFSTFRDCQTCNSRAILSKEKC